MAGIRLTLKALSMPFLSQDNLGLIVEITTDLKNLVTNWQELILGGKSWICLYQSMAKLREKTRITFYQTRYFFSTVLKDGKFGWFHYIRIFAEFVDLTSYWWTGDPRHGTYKLWPWTISRWITIPWAPHRSLGGPGLSNFKHWWIPPTK